MASDQASRCGRCSGLGHQRVRHVGGHGANDGRDPRGEVEGVALEPETGSGTRGGRAGNGEPGTVTPSGASVRGSSGRASGAPPPGSRLPASRIVTDAGLHRHNHPDRRPDWTFEPKYDGVRVLAFASGSSVRLITRNGKDKSHQFPEVTAGVRALAPPAQAAVRAGRRDRRVRGRRTRAVPGAAGSHAPAGDDGHRRSGDEHAVRADRVRPPRRWRHCADRPAVDRSPQATRALRRHAAAEGRATR